tara:strand:+ start:1408 stop:1740 length:333 start_codon:yes stop_codon:yes gene_type:complete
MNNNAHFLFSIFGFFGFTFFLVVSCIMGEEILISLFKASLGCLFFAIVGRYLLCFALSGQNSNLANDKTLNNDVGNKFTKPNLPVDPSISTKEAMSEAVTKPRRLIGAKA